MPSPRPRGRSGRVTTPTTLYLAPEAVISRSRMWAASAGVPMKTIFSGSAILDPHRGGTLEVGFALLDQLLEFAFVEFAFDPADPIDKQFAVEMIDLMLQRDRQQIVGFDLDFLLVRCPRAHQHVRRALDFGCVIDHRETSFFPGYFSFRFNDLRID